MNVQVRRDGKIYEMEFSRGKTTQKMREIGTCGTTGTTTTFWPDEEIFETTVYNYDTLRDRLQETAFLNKNLKIVLKDERASTPQVDEFCYAGGIIDFVKYLNDGKTVPDGLKNPIYLSGASEPDAPVEKTGEVEDRDAVEQPRTPRPSSPTRTTSTRPRAACIWRASAPPSPA